MTDGLAVLVHDVMAAMARNPSESPSADFLVSPSALSVSSKLALSLDSGILSWGLLCPAREGSTSPRSSSSMSVYSASPSYQRHCSLTYFSMRSMCSGLRPVSLR